MPSSDPKGINWARSSRNPTTSQATLLPSRDRSQTRSPMVSAACAPPTSTSIPMIAVTRPYIREDGILSIWEARL